MDKIQFLKKAGIKQPACMSIADQKRVCILVLQARDFEADLPAGKLNGSRFVDRDAKELGIKIDWRG